MMDNIFYEKPSWQRIYLSEGMCGFNRSKYGKAFMVGDIITYYPYLKIDYYEISNSNSPYFKHLIYNIYEFCFKPETVHYFQHTDIISAGEKTQYYVIELFPGFRAYYHPMKVGAREYMQVDQCYKGYGRLDISDQQETEYYKPPFFMKDLVKMGKLIGISEDLIQKDFSAKYVRNVRRLRYGNKAYCDEDALEWFGYYGNLDEFKINVSSYMGHAMEYESTDSQKLTGHDHNFIFALEVV